jgi:hypothetical protein
VEWLNDAIEKVNAQLQVVQEGGIGVPAQRK